MHHTHRILVILGLAGATAAAITVVGTRSSLSAATTAVPNVIAANCHDSVACVRLVNSGSGVAISANAQKNNAIVGTSSSALTGPANANRTVGGVVGVDRSRVPNGLNTSAGLVGLAADGLGVLGISETHNGIAGLTFNNGLKTGFSTFGVFGYDRALDRSGLNVGVGGLSTYGVGVEGISLRSTGAIGVTSAASANATTNYSGFGVQGFDSSTDGGYGNVGVSAISNGTALLAISYAPLQPVRKKPRPAILTVCGGSPAIIAKDTSGAKLMTLDCKGNLTIAGHLTQPESVSTTPSADGSLALVHNERATRATIEETGSSELRNGVRFVALSAEFTNATDRHAAYALLLTPAGDSRGLYVTKAANGFIVRENSGGRSNVAFDYRVVGTPLRATNVAASDDRAASSQEVQELRTMVERLKLRQASALRP